MSHAALHCYLLPYHIDKKGDVYVLLGRKNVFSTQDGFIHNNPGQVVIIGGGCGKQVNRNIRVDKTKYASIREFVEETGLDVVFNEIKLHKQTKNFEAFFYKIDNMEKYKKINSRSREFNSEHRELNNVEWHKLENAIELMDPKNNFNPPGFGYNDISNYLLLWKRNKWGLDFLLPTFFKYIQRNERFLRGYENSVLDDLFAYGGKSKYFHLFADFLAEFVKKRSYIDWYHESLQFLQSKEGRKLKSPPRKSQPLRPRSGDSIRPSARPKSLRPQSIRPRPHSGNGVNKKRNLQPW